jgi:hypothetical protein
MIVIIILIQKEEDEKVEAINESVQSDDLRKVLLLFIERK